MEKSVECHGKNEGSINAAGGSFGEYAQAKENRYFKEQDERILNDMAAKLKDESTKKSEAK